MNRPYRYPDLPIKRVPAESPRRILLESLLEEDGIFSHGPRQTRSVDLPKPFRRSSPQGFQPDERAFLSRFLRFSRREDHSRPPPPIDRRVRGTLDHTSTPHPPR